MSHFAKNKITGLNVEKIDFGLVEKAVNLLEEKSVLDFERVSEIKNWDGDIRTVRGIGIKVKGDTYGADVHMHKGELTIESESMGGRYDENTEFFREFKTAYTAVALQSSWESEGFSGSIEAKINNGQTTYLMDMEGY